MPTGLGATAAWIGANASTISAVSAAATAAGGIYAASQQGKAGAEAERQRKQQQALAGAIEKPQEAKTPDLSEIQKRNAQMAAAGGQLSGSSSTLLTGAGGVADSLLSLGTNTLLGR